MVKDMLTNQWVKDLVVGGAYSLVWGGLFTGLRQWCMNFGGKRVRANCDQWSCRLLCVAHAIGAVVLSGLSHLYYGPMAYYALGEPNTSLQTLTLQVSLGYFVFDLWWCLAAGGETLEMLMHHCVSIAMCASGLVMGVSGAELTGTLFGAEISNPLLQLRWFLIDLGYKGTPLHRTAEFAFAGMFLFCRVVWAPTLLVATWLSEKPHMVIKVGALAMQIISFIWSYFVYLKLRRALRGKSDRKTKEAADSEDESKVS